MTKVPHLVSKRKKSKKLGEPEIVRREDFMDCDLNGRVEMIRSLIPLGLIAVYEELDEEVTRWAGEKHSRKPEDQPYYRHGVNRGTIGLAGQRVPIRLPRVRGPEGDIRLESYDRLHRGGALNEQLFRQVLYGLSCRNYEKASEAIPGAIGLSGSSVSRQFVEASAAKLREFHERDLSDLDLVALFLDGKAFADDEMVIALGVTLTGEKHILGFVQTSTENGRSVSQFLGSLMDRGLDISLGLLVILDGSKGLRSAVKKAFRDKAIVQRCQWHKRENVLSYLAKTDQAYWRRRLQMAYGRPTYKEAKRELATIRRELQEINESAVASLDEGLEETLTLHRLGLFSVLGRSLKTTNCLESINAMAEERCGKVDHWRNSNQKQRWLASALLDIEPRLRRLIGRKHLSKLRVAIMRELEIDVKEKLAEEAA